MQEVGRISGDVERKLADRNQIESDVSELNSARDVLAADLEAKKAELEHLSEAFTRLDVEVERRKSELGRAVSDTDGVLGVISSALCSGILMFEPVRGFPALVTEKMFVCVSSKELIVFDSQELKVWMRLAFAQFQVLIAYVENTQEIRVKGLVKDLEFVLRVPPEQSQTGKWLWALGSIEATSGANDARNPVKKLQSSKSLVALGMDKSQSSRTSGASSSRSDSIAADKKAIAGSRKDTSEPLSLPPINVEELRASSRSSSDSIPGEKKSIAGSRKDISDTSSLPPIYEEKHSTSGSVELSTDTINRIPSNALSSSVYLNSDAPILASSQTAQEPIAFKKMPSSSQVASANSFKRMMSSSQAAPATPFADTLNPEHPLPVTLRKMQSSPVQRGASSTELRISNHTNSSAWRKTQSSVMPK